MNPGESVAQLLFQLGQEALVEASVAAAIERGPQECVRQLAAGRNV